MRYYDIIPIKDHQYNIFDTIEYVAYRLGFSYQEILKELGAKSTSDLIAFAHRQMVYPYFNFETFLIDRLNGLLKEFDVPLRVIKADRRKFAK